MDNLQKIVEQIDNLKEKLTDGEYKTLMDDLGLLHKKREISAKYNHRYRYWTSPLVARKRQKVQQIKSSLNDALQA